MPFSTFQHTYIQCYNNWRHNSATVQLFAQVEISGYILPVTQLQQLTIWLHYCCTAVFRKCWSILAGEFYRLAKAVCFKNSYRQFQFLLHVENICHWIIILDPSNIADLALLQLVWRIFCCQMKLYWRSWATLVLVTSFNVPKCPKDSTQFVKTNHWAIDQAH